MRLGRLVFALGLAISVALATIARAEEAAAPPAEAAPAQPAVLPSNDTRQSICLMVEAAARANGLPVEFFARVIWQRSEEHTSELQSHLNLVCRLLLEKKKK